MQVKLIVPGKPVGKERPRFAKGRAYTPSMTAVYEEDVRKLYKVNRMMEGTLEAKIVAYYPIPKSTSNKKRVPMLNGTVKPVVKPDLDNIAKIILDSLNKVAYADDSQVVSLSVSKFYDDNPRVEVTLIELEDEIYIQGKL